MPEPLTHVTLLFADAAFGRVQRERFGLAGCHQHVELDLAADLRECYARAQQLQACAPHRELGPDMTLRALEERINTL